jgi:hypothetical protein
LQEIKKLTTTKAFRNASPAGRLGLIVQTAAKFTDNSQEALGVAFSSVYRKGPLGISIRSELTGLIIPAGVMNEQAVGSDKAEHLLANAALSLQGSRLENAALIAVGDMLEVFQPLGFGKYDPGDREANRAGLAMGMAVSNGIIRLESFNLSDIP